MANLNEIELKAQQYSKQRSRLAASVMELTVALEKLKRKAMPDIKASVNETAATLAELQALIEQAKEHFVRPRTIIFHGIKVGFKKQKGKIEIPDEEKTIKLIRKHFPDQSDLLITTKEMVSKDALANVSVADLKRIACNVVADGDAVVASPVDGEVDKIVNALLKDSSKEGGE